MWLSAFDGLILFIMNPAHYRIPVSLIFKVLAQQGIYTKQFVSSNVVDSPEIVRPQLAAFSTPSLTRTTFLWARACEPVVCNTSK